MEWGVLGHIEETQVPGQGAGTLTFRTGGSMGGIE